MTNTERTIKCRKSIRKMGTRAGQPHYGAECVVCREVLAIGHLSKPAAERKFAEHAAAYLATRTHWA